MIHLIIQVGYVYALGTNSESPGVREECVMEQLVEGVVL